MPAPIAGAGAAQAYEIANQSILGRVVATLSDGTEVKALGLVPGHPAAQLGFSSAQEAAYAVQKTIWDTAVDAYRPAEGVAILKHEGGFVATAVNDSLLGKFRLPNGGTAVQALDGSPKLGRGVEMLLTGSGEIVSPNAGRVSEKLLGHVPVATNFPMGQPVLNGAADAANGAGLLGGMSRGTKIALAVGAAAGVAAIGVGIWAAARDDD